MSVRTTHHATFVAERRYPASPARVFNAEQPVVLDGADSWADHEHGTDELLQSPGRELGRAAGRPVRR